MLAPQLREYDLTAQLRELEPDGVQELAWTMRKRKNLPAKLGALALLFDRSRGRPTVAVDATAEVNGQLNLFSGLGIPDEDVPMIADELIRAIEQDKLAAKTIDLAASPAPEREGAGL